MNFISNEARMKYKEIVGRYSCMRPIIERKLEELPEKFIANANFLRSQYPTVEFIAACIELKSDELDALSEFKYHKDEYLSKLEKIIDRELRMKCGVDYKLQFLWTNLSRDSSDEVIGKIDFQLTLTPPLT